MKPAHGQLLYTIWYHDSEGQELAFFLLLDRSNQSVELPRGRQAPWRRQ